MAESYTDWTLVSLSPLSVGWMTAAVAAVVVAALFVLWSYRGAKRRWLLMAMRTVAAILVVGFLTEPALQLRVVRKIRNRLAIVVDRSESMSLTTNNNRSRYDNVRALLERDRETIAQLGESHIIEWFDLDGALGTSDLANEPQGERTDLLAGLELARETGAGRPLAAIVLLSDGADNVALESNVRGRLTDSAVERLERLQAPVNTVDASGADAYKDVAITEVLSDEFAFVHNTVEIEVEVHATGFGSLTVPVTLRREGDVIATQEAVTSEDDPARIVFKTKPDRIGEFVYTVSLPAFAGEAISANNQRAFVIQVIRDKIRVLQVAGRPSWDERFLRQHLKENPNVDLISFFILRTPTDDSGVHESELSLIPFPTDKIFHTELHTFDVVIFQNFDYRAYRMDHYLRNIRDAVRGGLGFVMLGGNQSFANGGYLGTEIDEIVPMALDDGGIRRDVTKPTLTEAGRLHPVTDLSRGAGNNEAIWRRMPAWASTNVTGGLMPDATALLVDPRTQTKDGQPLPLLAVMDAGEGRAMAIATDSMWRWRFAASRNGGAAERAYHKLWSNALRWLVRDPEHSRVRVLPEKRRFDVGEDVEVTFQVLGADYRPVPYAHIRAALEESGGSVVSVEDLTAGETGVARHRYTELQAGAYRIIASAAASGEQLGEGRGVFVIESKSVERSQGAPRPDLLGKIAKVTEGRAFRADEGSLWEQLEVIDPDVVEVDRRRNIELWDNGWALALGVLLLAAEWAIRRRRGYL